MTQQQNGVTGRSRVINLSRRFNWPTGKTTTKFPVGKIRCWGIPFLTGTRGKPRVLFLSKDTPAASIRLNGVATHLCFLHSWQQDPKTVNKEAPREGMVVGEYEITYADGTKHIQPIRTRYEVNMLWEESPGPAWLAATWPQRTPMAADEPPPSDTPWGLLQYGLRRGHAYPALPLLMYPLPNPHPDKPLRFLTLRGLSESPLLIGGLTLFHGTAHPLQHLPRRPYRIKTDGTAPTITKAEVDMGYMVRIEKANPPRGAKWLSHPGQNETTEPSEHILHLTGAPDATVSVQMQQDGRKKQVKFSLGEAYHKRRSVRPGATLEVLGRDRQWLQVRVVDATTGQPTPARIHFSGPRGNYVAPYGHHEKINCNWFEDYGADVYCNGKPWAYVHGEFVTDLPVGDLYVEIMKGFEYAPTRQKIRIAPGQKLLELKLDRWIDLRNASWVTADTHVHFISPHTAWLEGMAEGVNVVNLLASQWGRLFTNVGDIIGKPNVVENDTIVYVGTENRNHMLGHMSLLGTQGLPVYPMCGGGPSEADLGDPDLRLLAEWARENRAKGGVVIRPHFPFCGHTEDPLPIIQGLVDALEVNPWYEFPVQEWYRYLNNGYRVAVCCGTDKMAASTAIGRDRTYAKLDPNRPFDYDHWAAAVRAGRTFCTTGPLLDLTVDGHAIGDTIPMSADGGTVEVHAWSESIWPLHHLEVVVNGQVVARQDAPTGGAKRLEVKQRIPIHRSGWIAARSQGDPTVEEFRQKAAHTSPVYLTCGDRRAYDGPALQHMLHLVQGGMEYLNAIATAFDEPSRRRMVKQLQEAQNDLRVRLVTES